MFNKKNQKIVKIIWSAVGIIVAISMVLLYAPIF